MKFQEYDTVRLSRDIPEENLSRGSTGAILMVYDSDPPEFEVEFTDSVGNTVALLTLKSTDIEWVSSI